MLAGRHLLLPVRLEQDLRSLQIVRFIEVQTVYFLRFFLSILSNYSIKNTSFAASFPGISQLGSAFIFLR